MTRPSGALDAAAVAGAQRRSDGRGEAPALLLLALWLASYGVATRIAWAAPQRQRRGQNRVVWR